MNSIKCETRLFYCYYVKIYESCAIQKTPVVSNVEPYSKQQHINNGKEKKNVSNNFSIVLMVTFFRYNTVTAIKRARNFFILFMYYSNLMKSLISLTATYVFHVLHVCEPDTYHLKYKMVCDSVITR